MPSFSWRYCSIFLGQEKTALFCGLYLSASLSCFFLRYRILALNEADQYEDYGQDEEDVDESRHDMKTDESDGPQNDEDDCDGSEHLIFLIRLLPTDGSIDNSL
jgi:hypothetical protein